MLDGISHCREPVNATNPILSSFNAKQVAVVAVKDENGKITLHEAGSTLTAERAVMTGFCGSLTALIFLNATTGAASSALADVGVTRHFMKELAGTLTAGGSALFVLVRRPSPDRKRVLEDLRGIGGKILKTSVSHEDTAILQAALSAARRQVPFPKL